MKKMSLVRIIRSELSHFKNVEYGEIRYMSYGSVESKGEISGQDVEGIYGPNGSGKTAVVEAFDILKHILCGIQIPYSTYEGILDSNGATRLTTSFFIEGDQNKYKVVYEVALKVLKEEKRIVIQSEKLKFWNRGAGWKCEKELFFSNPYYNEEALLDGADVDMKSRPENYYAKTGFQGILKNLSVFCAQKGCSVFFNDLTYKSFSSAEKEMNRDSELSEIIIGLSDFGKLFFQVVKVSQLGDVNRNIIPLNMHNQTKDTIVQGCIPLFMNGRGEVQEQIFDQLKRAIDSINIALTAIVPNLMIELEVRSEEIRENGKYMQVEVYSDRDGKRFLTKYESEGIKRIISLLQYLIVLYNSPNVCLVVDELDSGIFEYLLGELLGILNEEAKGQLIFTSHNLRVLEKLPNKNIIYSTMNPKNRYIRMTGVEKNHNRRDFYIRSIILGGQKEELYDEMSLEDIGYAFRQAGQMEKKEDNIEISLSDVFKRELEG